MNKLKRLEEVLEQEIKRNAPPSVLQAIANQWAKLYNSDPPEKPKDVK